MHDQAPQTLDQVIDTYKNDLATAKRLRDYGMEVETDGRLKLALTALIERVIGEDEVEDIDLSKSAKSRWGVRARNRVRAEQRKRLANLTKNGERDDAN